MFRVRTIAGGVERRAASLMYMYIDIHIYIYIYIYIQGCRYAITGSRGSGSPIRIHTIQSGPTQIKSNSQFRASRPASTRCAQAHALVDVMNEKIVEPTNPDSINVSEPQNLAQVCDEWCQGLHGDLVAQSPPPLAPP